MITQTKYLTVALATLTAILMTGPTVHAEEDEDDFIDLTQVPPAALSVLQARSAGTPLKVEKDDEDGVVSYEAKFTINGKKLEIKVNAQGQVIAEEMEIALQATPAAALAAIQRAVPGGSVTKVTKETEGGKITYEAEVVLNGKTLEVKVAADGSAVAEESEEKEHEGKGENEKKD